ncbi:MAG TPA: hypothetical protein VMS65_16155, partial [Polyangiaceae bacterium]|nr:hypothetical protein [Polyangiaceae bacterium]
ELRTGALAPEHEATPLELEPVARHSGPEFETLRFQFQGTRRVRLDGSTAVDVPGATFAFVSDALDLKGGVLWVRRPIAKANEPISGTLFTSAQGGPGIRFDLRVKSGAAMPSSKPEVEVEWLRALAANPRGDSFNGDPFSAFMRRRLLELAAKKQPIRRGSPVSPSLRAGQNATDLSRLMETTTGRSQIQQALQANDTLALDLAREPKRLPLAAAKPPELPRADYDAMLGALGRMPPAEPLAAVAPADFWYVRSRNFAAFLDLLELSETFGQPAADLLGGRSENRGTTARYTAEVALERTELARVLGPSVIESVAVVGSDPYVHDGTDVTFVFKVTAPPLFEAALAKALAKHASAHGGVTKSEVAHEGVTIRIARSPDGRVRQHRASVAGVELVSNSPGAIRRVISTALGKAPRLADERDFQYLLARDAGTPDETLAFLSDRFVLSVIGPAQKIAQARRQLALAELTTPGFAALLFGWTHGRTPKDPAELVRSGELFANELKHADGAPITWQPGKPAASRWGTTAALEPLIDLPPVKKISAAEQRAYSDFSSRYAFTWSEYVDPVIVRFARSSDSGERYDVRIRALPLLRRENRELLQMVGAAAVEVPALDSGLRWVLALDKDASLRHELDGYARFGGHSLKFDWLGDSVMLGIADRAELTSVAHRFVSDRLEPPDDDRKRLDELDALAKLPLYASVEVKNRLGAVVALGVLRKLAEEVARDMIQWRDGGKHREVAITDVAILPSAMLRGGHVFYALCPNALIFALNRSVLERLIDDELDGKSPRGASEARRSDDGQFVIELGAKKDGALLRVIGWLTAAELVERTASRQSAEAVLRGAPESRASADAFETFARATLGHVPLTPDGNLYQYSAEGIRDPMRGTPHAPIFPATPVAGSPLATVLARFARIRTSIAFDTEPGARANELDMQSFSAKVSLELR